MKQIQIILNEISRGKNAVKKLFVFRAFNKSLLAGAHTKDNKDSLFSTNQFHQKNKILHKEHFLTFLIPFLSYFSFITQCSVDKQNWHVLPADFTGNPKNSRFTKKILLLPFFQSSTPFMCSTCNRELYFLHIEWGKCTVSFSKYDFKTKWKEK